MLQEEVPGEASGWPGPVLAIAITWYVNQKIEAPVPLSTLISK